MLGNALVSWCIARSLALTFTTGPLIMAGIAMGLVAFGTGPLVTACLLALRGLVGTALPVVWWTWMARTLPEDAEAGGGLALDRFGHAGGGTLLAGSAFVAAYTLLKSSALPGNGND